MIFLNESILDIFDDILSVIMNRTNVVPKIFLVDSFSILSNSIYKGCRSL